MQLLEIELDPGETVVAEAGAMNYMEADIEFEWRLGDGSKPNEGVIGKLFSAAKRTFTGLSPSSWHTSPIRDQRKPLLPLPPPFPDKIIALNQAMTGDVFCQ
ncbi:MAG: hypothetical protein CMI60_07495 [Parvibaculum sp.]|jgi:uncharacterized protein (AIM24 family)|nr:hypothetical protein [Parvibaculum sp.]|tara:strand:- start:71 stop:376 length:306 start_codon:yes stop_codon:yes gene_type:complete